MTRPRLIVAVFALLCLAGVPGKAQHFTIDSLQGDITQNEVDTFLNAASAIPIPTSQWTATDSHNILADGYGGQDLEAINDMYALTADMPNLSAEHTQLLNLAMQWTEAWLIHRNDLPLGQGQVMWTGNVEPVWPPNSPIVYGSPSDTYYESEVGDTVGHMAYTAYNILNTPSLCNNTVPDGDPNGFGATYLDRAKTYVSMLECTMSTSFTPYFIDPNTLLIMRPSASQGYLSSFHNVNAWNVQFMLANAYWRLAQCHVILGDNPPPPMTTADYQAIVQNVTDMFVQNAVPITAQDGTPVYDWGYCNYGDCTNKLTGEQIGVHGSYDMWGLTRAYSTGYSTVPQLSDMQSYAATVEHEMTLSINPSTGAATYSSYNDRCCSSSTYSYLPPGFAFLTPYDTNIYLPFASADITSGRQQKSAILTANILWAKHWIATHSPGTAGLPVAAASESGDDGCATACDVTQTIDGVWGTYWQSTTDGTNSVSVQYDLGASYNISCKWAGIRATPAPRNSTLIPRPTASIGPPCSAASTAAVPPRASRPTISRRP